MIFAWMAGLALLLLLPLGWAFRRGAAPARRREAALALHAAQLAELRRDLGDERIGAEEYRAAKLEVERRVLLADMAVEPPLAGDARLLLVGVVVAVPMLAFALYLPGSAWWVPSEPHAQWLARQEQAQTALNLVIARVRARLATAPAGSADESEGRAYLGEALAEQAGTITPQALALFKQSLAEAPAGASWRALDEERLAQAGQ